MTPQDDDRMDGAADGEESMQQPEMAAMPDEAPLPETVISASPELSVPSSQFPVEETGEDGVEDTVGQADSGTVEEVVEVGASEAFDVADTGGTPVLQGVVAEAADPGSLTIDIEPPVAEYEPGAEAVAPVAVPPASQEVAARVPAKRRRILSGGWTMGLLLSGIGIIAACVLIPQGDETRKLMYERERLRQDLEQVQKQVATNDEFLKRVQDDPTLAQRLAQRQMKMVPAGSQVLDVDASPTKDDKSPFLIVSVPPPAEMPPFQPRGGWFSEKCRDGRSQLYMIGGGLMLVAAGLVLGASGPRD